jgi:hypothetical protein
MKPVIAGPSNPINPKAAAAVNKATTNRAAASKAASKNAEVDCYSRISEEAPLIPQHDLEKGHGNEGCRGYFVDPYFLMISDIVCGAPGGRNYPPHFLGASGVTIERGTREFSTISYSRDPKGSDSSAWYGLSNYLTRQSLRLPRRG